jgi:hypothetical protein
LAVIFCWFGIVSSFSKLHDASPRDQRQWWALSAAGPSH